MKIGDIATQSGVSCKTIRYYESVGLIPAAARRDNGYRSYDEGDLHTLRFIHRARDLGFSVAEVQELLALWRNKRRRSAAVKAIAIKKIDEIERKMTALEAMKRTIRHLARNCHGDDRPECPILDELAGNRARWHDATLRPITPGAASHQRHRSRTRFIPAPATS